MSKKHNIEVEVLDSGRVILHVNGFSLDVTADEDGIITTLTKGDEVQTELSFDWDEKHINS